MKWLLHAANRETHKVGQFRRSGFSGASTAYGRLLHGVGPRRDAATLIPIIQHHVEPRTQIWSDEWGAYNNLNGLEYVHETVNHTQYFVDPISGCHTNNTERRWAACKASFWRHSNVQRHMLPTSTCAIIPAPISHVSQSAYNVLYNC